MHARRSLLDLVQVVLSATLQRMRQQRRCAECSGTQFYVLDQVLTPAQDSNSAVVPVRLFSHYTKTGESGFLGAKHARISVGIEAWVCVHCARVETYARGLDALARFAAEGVQGVRRVSTTPAEEAGTLRPDAPTGGYPLAGSAHVSGSVAAPPSALSSSSQAPGLAAPSPNPAPLISSVTRAAPSVRPTRPSVPSAKPSSKPPET